MAKVYTNKPNSLENKLANYCGFNAEQSMDWKKYLKAMLLFNFFGLILVYAIQRLQIFLPLNPQQMADVPPTLAFNTAISFVTNTNWQAYSGEGVMSYFTQTLAFTVQNFLSAATGMAILVAFIRGLIGQETNNLGNFWLDMIRSIMYILLPLSLMFSVALVSQGVIQNYKAYQTVAVLDANKDEQVIPMGPVASQAAIKLIGSNGGGFFNVNSAHPYENPNLISNFLQLVAILLLPAAFCYTFGVMAKDRHQGWILLIAMLIIFIPAAYINIFSEKQGNPLLNDVHILNTGNMEGKEVRFGVEHSALWSVATTATSCGAVNTMHDSLMPMSNLVCLMMIYLGEIVFGGVGAGLYGMLVFVIITVFIAGLMIGRTPEYLGKKIEPFEMKMVALIVLVMPLCVLILTAIASVTQTGTSSISNPGAHGLMEILYAFNSMRNNNGSALAGLNADTNFYNITGGIIMLINRYWVAIATLAIAGSLASKKIIPSGLGTLATYNTLFLMLLLGVILIVGALSFLPTLALGPIIEHLLIWGNHAS